MRTPFANPPAPKKADNSFAEKPDSSIYSRHARFGDLTIPLDKHSFSDIRAQRNIDRHRAYHRGQASRLTYFACLVQHRLSPGLLRGSAVSSYGHAAMSALSERARFS
jgi:hypothetical protein